MSGADYGGYDIVKHGTNDPRKCAEYCTADQNCKLFVTATNTQECWLKSAGGIKSNAGNRITYSKIGYDVDAQTRQQAEQAAARAAQDPLSAYAAPVRGSDYSGTDVAKHRTNDPRKCAEYCTADARCNFFVTATNSQECWLKTNVGRQSNAGNRNTYAKNGYPLPAAATGPQTWGGRGR